MSLNTDSGPQIWSVWLTSKARRRRSCGKPFSAVPAASFEETGRYAFRRGAR